MASEQIMNYVIIIIQIILLAVQIVTGNNYLFIPILLLAFLRLALDN